jgi:branched-chain amino acid transport system ATP-binding protein
MKATDIIRDEHRSLAAVLHGFGYLMTEILGGRSAPDFELFDAMLRYIDGFPERLHHPKEDQYLFPAVRRRSPGMAATLDELERQHAESPGLILKLRSSLNRFRSNGIVSAPQFARTLEDYAAFHWRHMRMEEDEVLPAAEATLTADDWTAIDDAFAANQDPILGIPVTREFRELFRRIALLAPAPIGVGPAKGPKGR